MKKNYILFGLLFLCLNFIGFGQTTVCFDFDNGYPNGTTFSNENLDPNIRFTTYQNSAGTNTRIWDNQLRCYQDATKGGGFIIEALNGVTITSVVINASGSTGDAEYIVDGGGATSLSAGATYSMTGLSATTDVEFYQRESGSSNRIYIDDFCVTYTSGGSSCSISFSGLGSITCNDNSTIPNATDDYITFELNPTGSNLGSNYTVSVSSGTISPSTAVAYGSATTFTLQNGSAGAGDVTITITDDTDGSCTFMDTITDPGSCSSSCSSIFSDDFSSGLGSWSNTGDWTTSSGELKHDLSGVESESYIYADIGSQNLSSGNFEWEFCMRNGNWDPSGSNDFVYYLLSSNSDLQSNGTGYAVGINQNNTSDILTLYSVNNGTYTSIITSAYNWDANDDVCVRVSRSSSGDWELFYNDGSGEASAGTTTNTDFISGNYTGVFFDFSSSRAGLLWIDDVSICSEAAAPTPEIQLIDNTATNQNCGYTIDYGSQANASNTDLTFDIENIGTADLTVSSFGISGTDAGDFSVVTPAAPFTVTASTSQTVTVRFTPSSDGTKNATLTINNNDSNEGTCTVDLTGIGFTPSPEIDVERNTNASIPLSTCVSNPPNTGNNTLFGTTVIGNTSAPKTYYISNEGTADLTVTAISLSSGSDFNLLNLPTLPLTLSAGNDASFEIEFAPSTTGSLEDTITILSNDSDEATYTFCVGGTGDCAATSISITPSEGPANTIVSVTGSDFGGSTSATINGLSATVNVLSATQLELTIPSGATTGSIEVTNDLSCVSSELFTVFDNAISSCEGTGTPPLELFISEITDHGTGSHSYVEIYNGTGSSVNLSGYEIRIHNNGDVNPTNTVPLMGTVANDDVFVLAFGSTQATDPHAAHGFDQSSAISGINEDDNIRLYNGATWVDLWGDTTGSAFTIVSKDYTYRRKNTGITAPSTTWDATDWDAFTPVDYTDIGTYDYSVGTPPVINTHPTTTSNCDLSATLSVTATEGYNGTSPADTQELTYQWYYSASGDNGWTAVPNDATFDDVTQATLTINNVLNALDYQFYCQVREDDATCYQASDAVKLDINRTTWDGSSWDNGTPTTSTIAVIDGNYNTGANGNIDACQLVVNSSNILNVTNSSYVRIVNNVVNDGTLTVQTHGAFVQDGSGVAGSGSSGTFTNNGTARVVKETELLNNWYEYTYWSSPVAGQTISSAFPNTPADRRFWFNTANYWDEYIEVNNDNSNSTVGQDDVDDNGDDWQLANGTDVMSQGVGYAATSSPSGMYPGSDIATFIGAFNTGDYTTPIVVNAHAPDNDWNFIGNPYASAIDFDDVYTANSTLIDGAASYGHMLHLQVMIIMVMKTSTLRKQIMQLLQLVVGILLEEVA